MGLIHYDISRYSLAQMVAIPAVLLVLSLISIGLTFASTGMPVMPGMDFKGGTAVTVFTADTPDQIRATFTGYSIANIGEGVNNGKLIRFEPMADERFNELSALVAQKYPDAKIDQIGASFGQTLQNQAFLALIFSFVGMSIVIFLIFRTFVPSMAVVISAFADMAMTAATMNVVGLPLSLGTTAALLMLIGYSVDSDILLTMRVLKRQGNLNDKMAGAFRTGIIMTSTAIAAVAAMFIVSWIGQVTIIWEMSAVLLIGLFFDIMNTWLTNAGLIKWYVQKRGGK
jgi:preprotein translocase subunit SecF